jgi:hypothetical protein
VAVENGLLTWINGIADRGCIATNGSTIVVSDRWVTCVCSRQSSSRSVSRLRYAAEYDAAEEEIASYREWSYVPLRPGDDY